jgi:hypothetical protein
MMPDSLRLFGIEGAGNPVAGCYPNNDMLIDFAIALNVDWGEFYLTDLPGKAVSLNWSTLSEANNDYFVVQKMETLQHAWWDMTIIDGSENSSSQLDYSYTDPYVSNGINYYRIKQVDLDGKHSYSRTLKVNKNLEGFVPVKIYPTVASNELIIEGAKNAEISFMSIEGIEQERLTLKSNYEKLSISEIPEGVYLLQIVNGEKLTIEKIIIQH